MRLGRLNSFYLMKTNVLLPFHLFGPRWTPGMMTVKTYSAAYLLLVFSVRCPGGVGACAC